MPCRASPRSGRADRRIARSAATSRVRTIDLKAAIYGRGDSLQVVLIRADHKIIAA
jgi:hypothetical protein